MELGNLKDYSYKYLKSMYAEIGKEIAEREKGLSMYIIAKLKNGVYRIEWLDDTSSLAAVGRDPNGRVWYQPCDWKYGPNYDWSRVLEIIPIETQK